MRYIDETLRDTARRHAHRRVARTHHPNAFEQSHAAIHLETEVARSQGGTRLERFNQRRRDVGTELAGGILTPTGRNALEVQRRKFPLQLVLKGEIHRERHIRLAMAQRSLGFPRIVVAVVAEEHDLTADLRLEFPCRDEFRIQKPPRKKTARLLTETDDRAAHGSDTDEGLTSRGMTACRPRLNSTHAAQPMGLSQR